MISSKKRILIKYLFPVLYALMIRILFGLSEFNDIFQVMSLSFMFIGPFVMGALFSFLSDKEDNKKIAYLVFAAWIPIFIFLLVTILLKIEGWACWLMALPLFLIFASIGSIIGKYIKNARKNITYVSALALLPFLLSIFESRIEKPLQVYKAYNFIDINAPEEKIWNLITRVNRIEENEDSGWLNKALGFPRPVEAILNYEGVGAYRKAIFTNGLVFHETVTEYQHLKKMTFDIKANPDEIPSTTLDEHVVVGGDFFDVKNGTYELEKIAQNKYRLHLYSHFTMKTAFNFYAATWAKWIMKDIQQNILRVEKNRAEAI